MREEVPRLEPESEEAVRGDAMAAPGEVERPAEGDRLQADAVDGEANVRTINGRNYDAAVVGPDGFRAGYVWQDGNYVAVACEPGIAYAAPYGAFAGWSVVTQPAYVNYPVYPTYPVETAVQVALQNLGLYPGPIDGLASSCTAAIEQYQTQSSLDVTGAISPGLLTALGIQATFN